MEKFNITSGDFASICCFYKRILHINLQYLVDMLETKRFCISSLSFKARCEKTVFGVSDQLRHKAVVQPQEMARCLKFRI